MCDPSKDEREVGSGVYFFQFIIIKTRNCSCPVSYVSFVTPLSPSLRHKYTAAVEYLKNLFLTVKTTWFYGFPLGSGERKLAYTKEKKSAKKVAAWAVFSKSHLLNCKVTKYQRFFYVRTYKCRISTILWVKNLYTQWHSGTAFTSYVGFPCSISTED